MKNKISDRSTLQSFTPLPRIEYVEEPIRIERFMVLLYPNGRIIFKGSRKDIDRFVEQCTEHGVDLNVEGISFCG